MADILNKGEASRFIKGTSIAKHREWRGLSDTWYDYTQWVGNLAIMGGFVAKAPVRIMKGIMTYRWFGSYLGAFNMIDNVTWGVRGPALRATHTLMHAIMSGSTGYLADMMKADRRFGANENADKMVYLEQTMPCEIMAGFPNLKGMSFEAFEGLLACFMDKDICAHYIDAIMEYGLAADSCRLSANAVGVAIEDDYPDIAACLVTNNMPCDSSTMNSQMIERRLTIPTHPGCMPMRWEDPATDKYAVFVLRDVIRFISEQTGEKWDWDAFFAALPKTNAETKAELDRWDYMPTPYSAYGGCVTGLYRVFFYNLSAGTLPYCEKANKKVAEIMEKAYAEKINCFPKTRHRAILWAAPPTYYLGFVQWMYNCWGILQVCNMDAFVGSLTVPENEGEDAALLGVAKLYERGTMRAQLTGGYQHLLEFWERGRQFNCDMVIMFDDITCKGAEGMAGRINDMAKDQPFKLMWVQHDLFDSRTVTKQQVRDQVNSFMTAVMQEQPLDESLMEFDDSIGW